MLVPIAAPVRGANTNVSPFVQPPDQPTIMNGCTNSFKLGSITKDTGYSRQGAQVEAGQPILGLYQYIQNSTTERELAVSNDTTAANTQLRYRTNGAGAWTVLAVGATWNGFTGQRAEIQGFIGYYFIVGVDSAGTFLPVGSVTGTTFSTATNVTNMPQAKYIVRYRDRLYVLNCFYAATAFPFRIVASSPVTAGAITWSVAGSPTSSAGGFLDVDFAYEITGAGVNWDRLMVFTTKGAYYYDQTAFKLIWDEGCSAHRTIKTKGPYMFWANRDGVWVSTGGQPQCISGEVRDFIKNAANPANFFAEIVDEVYWLYVGTVTVNGVTYSNCAIKYNINTSNWEWREFFNNMTIFGNYLDSSQKLRLHMGDTTGTVWNKAKYFDTTLVSADAQTTAGTGGQPIHSSFELAPTSIDDLGDAKIVRDLYVFADRAQGVNMKARIIDRNARILTPYKPIGQLKNYINTFQVNAGDGVLLQIEATEYSTNDYWSYLGAAMEVDREGRIPRKPQK